MAQKSLFWNALPNPNYETGYDRNINADDISDWLAVILTTGVIRSNTALAVSAAGNMNLSVNLGKAVINGKAYVNDSAVSMTVPIAPTGANNRIDLVVLRFNRNVSARTIQLAYVTGANDGSIPAIKRTDLFYDLVLAKITVQPNVTVINSGDIVDLRGDDSTVVTTESGTSLGYCPWLVAAKGYDDYYDAIVIKYTDEIELETAATVVQFNIPQYGWTGVDIVTVYTNGVRDDESTYTITGNSSITFDSQRTAGAKITVIVEKSLDGEGLGTALAGYQELQADVLALQNVDQFNYVCNGVNDNIVLSELMYGYSLSRGMSIKVYGSFGFSVPYSGEGTAASPYKWIYASCRFPTAMYRCEIDFTHCTPLNLPLNGTTYAGKYNEIFVGNVIQLKNVSVQATGTDASTRIKVFGTTSASLVKCTDCQFNIAGSLDTYISDTGTYVNCTANIINFTSHSYCFLLSASSLLRIIGGTYSAYTQISSSNAAVVYGTSSGQCAVLYGVNCPTFSRTGMYQKNAVQTNGGYVVASDTITTLLMAATGGTIRNTLAVNKYSAFE